MYDPSRTQPTTRRALTAKHELTCFLSTAEPGHGMISYWYKVCVCLCACVFVFVFVNGTHPAARPPLSGVGGP